MRIETMAMFSCCKTFSGKYIFSGNANFRKRKVFPCVWLHFKKFSGKYFLVFGKEEGKHKSENTSHNPEKKKSSTMKMFPVRRPCRDRDWRRDGVISRRSRSRLREIAPSIAISDWSWSSRSRTGSSPLARARALSLSLSYFPEMLWRENRSVKAFPWSKAFFLGQRISISRK